MQDNLGVVNTDTVLAAGINHLQSFRMTFKKAEYHRFRCNSTNRAVDLEVIWDKTDDEQ